MPPIPPSLQPIHAILGYLSLLAESPLNPDQTDSLRMLQQSGGNLLGLINDILDLTKVCYTRRRAIRLINSCASTRPPPAPTRTLSLCQSPSAVRNGLRLG
jgi:signal transduction histidine kinase